MKGLEKFRDSSFMENLWGNLYVSTIVMSLIFLIAMYLVQTFILT
jgi:hypothetical protein